MKIKKSAYLVFAAFFMTLQLGPWASLAQAEDVPPPPDDPEYYLQTFIITAYYSPLAGQSHYVTGSYEGDIYLNGNGTNGADGTPVFPGMIAAPKAYAFGTKMYIPGVGITSVHDRGGAIVTTGARGNAHDRLDVWMGHGDEGLARALTWGKRTVEVRVYGQNPAVKEAVSFDAYLAVEEFLTQTVLSPLEFPNDIYYGSEGEEVSKMQEYLVSWGYLNDVTGFYGSDTAQAVFEFQMDYNVVSGPDELGAGHFGPATRRQFDSVIKNGATKREADALSEGRALMKEHGDLYEDGGLFSAALQLGDSGVSVVRLQEELSNLGFLRLDATGYFGETTKHALFKFQQSQGLVSGKTDSGAGYLGPNTRYALNSIIEKRLDLKSLIAFQRQELSEGRLALMLPDKTLAQVKEEDLLPSR